MGDLYKKDLGFVIICGLYGFSTIGICLECPRKLPKIVTYQTFIVVVGGLGPE